MVVCCHSRENGNPVLDPRIRGDDNRNCHFQLILLYQKTIQFLSVSVPYHSLDNGFCLLCTTVLAGDEDDAIVVNVDA